jgi:signal transduction histidine kinase
MASRDALHLGLKIVALACAYVAAAKFGLALDAVGGFATLVWPATGIAIAALLLFGPRLWPGVALGALVANLWTGAPPLVALGIAAGNSAEALLAAYAVRRFGGYQGRSAELMVRQVVSLVLAAVPSAVLSASLGVSSLTLGGVVARGAAVETWRAWWLGDILGALIVTPLLLAWSRRLVAPRAAVVAEVSGLTVLLVASSALVFTAAAAAQESPFRQPYLVFPVMMWAALRFGPRGATASTLVVSAIAIWATASGEGPFVRERLATSLSFLQVFMATTAFAVLCLGAAAAERARATRLRDEMLAVVSHDLQNPLQIVRLATAVLARKSPGAEAQADAIHRAADRMQRLVTDLLDLAAFENGRLTIVPRAVSAGAILDECAEMMRPIAEARRLTLRVEKPSPDADVACDHARVLQTLSNIVGNAIKFTPEGRTISVAAGVADGAATVSVTDPGPGIAAEHLDRVFERYWRGDGKEAGTGLGLAIAKQIVEAHGGRIWAESAPERGTTIRFTLPLARAAPPQRNAAKGSWVSRQTTTANEPITKSAQAERIATRAPRE